MKALFSQRQYPDHHNPGFSHPYYPDKAAQTSNVSRMPEAQKADHDHQDHHHASLVTGRARSTLNALQMIRRRFEASQKELMTEQLSDQAAA